MKIRFAWDPVKAKSNIKKHRVSFELAARVFADPFARTEHDRFENGERRWRTLGIVEGHLLLLVAHTHKDDEDGTEVIRIISARRAESKERKCYEENHPL